MDILQCVVSVRHDVNLLVCFFQQHTQSSHLRLPPVVKNRSKHLAVLLSFPGSHRLHSPCVYVHRNVHKKRTLLDIYNVQLHGTQCLPGSLVSFALKPLSISTRYNVPRIHISIHTHRYTFLQQRSNNCNCITANHYKNYNILYHRSKMLLVVMWQFMLGLNFIC